MNERICTDSSTFTGYRANYYTTNTMFGGFGEVRTHDISGKNRMLCQLSYKSIGGEPRTRTWNLLLRRQLRYPIAPAPLAYLLRIELSTDGFGDHLDTLPLRYIFGCRDRNRTCLTWLMRPPSSPELRTLHHYGGEGETRTLTGFTPNSF